MLEIAMLIIMVTTLVAMLVLYRRGRGGGGFAGVEPEQGSLYVTGVSPPPDAPGEQYVTITGDLSGPTVPGTVVYGRFVWEVSRWPAVGDRLPVVYPPGKPDRWRIAGSGG